MYNKNILDDELMVLTENGSSEIPATLFIIGQPTIKNIITKFLRSHPFVGI